jgi:hypothetical protein
MIMPHKDDALDSIAFKILLKRGALETPSKMQRSRISKRASLLKPPEVIIPIEHIVKNKNKTHKTSRRILSAKDAAKQWSAIGRNASINAMILLNAANANAHDNLKLNRHVGKYENEILPYLHHIGQHIRSLPRNKTNFRIIEEYEYSKPDRNRTAKNRRIKHVNYFLQKDALSPLFRSIAISANGNCLFNSFAWWIITYYSLTNVDFYEMNEPLSHIIPKMSRTSPLNAAKGSHIEKVAELLRSMVCGFYDIYQVVERDLRETDLQLSSLADLNSQIAVLEPGHREKICKNAEWGTDVDARVMAYILKVNIVFVLTNEYAGRHYYSVEYGKLGRPTFYIFNTTDHYDVLYPSDREMQGSIAPLPVAK